MPSCRRERLRRTRLSALEDDRQIADHAAGPLRQRKLDRPVQILDDIAEPADDVKDHHLMNRVPSDPHLEACGLTAG
jgi:hypothetical protein